MPTRTKTIIGAGIVLYLLAVAAVALALLQGHGEDVGPPALREVEVARNAFGRFGLKLAGQRLSDDLKLVMLPDTISSDRLLASSLDRGHMYDVEVAGDYLLVARASYGLEVYNRHHAPVLAVEAHLDLGGRVVDLEVEGAFVYALLSKPARLCKVSIVDPLKPRLVKTLELSGTPLALLATADDLFVADYKQGLWQISPHLEVVAAPERFAGIDSCAKLASSEDQLYVASLDGRLWRLPLSQGTQTPRLLSSYGKQVRGLAVDERALHIQFKSGILQTYDVTTRGGLELVQEFKPPVIHEHVVGIELEQQGDLLLAFDATQGVKVYRRDIKGVLTLQGSVIKTGNFTSAAVVADVLYASSTRGLSSWALQGLSLNTSSQATRLTTGVIFSLERWNSLLFTESSSSGLQIFDLDDVGRPPAAFPDKELQGFAASGNHLWLNRKDLPLEGFHIDSDATLEPCRKIPGNGRIRRVRVFGEYLAVAGDGGVAIYSTENPCQPRLLTRLPMEGRVSDIILEGDYAFASSYTGKEIVAFNWRESGGPRVVGRYALPAPLSTFCSPRRLCKNNNFLYVALGRVGLLALDVSEPEDMKQFFYLDTPGYSGHLHIHDEMLYISDLYGGLRLIDVEATEKSGVPRVVGSYRAAVDTYDIAFVDDKLYLAGGVKGLVVMPEPWVLRTQDVNNNDNEAFVPLPADFPPGRYRLLAYNNAGHLNEDLVVTVPER